MERSNASGRGSSVDESRNVTAALIAFDLHLDGETHIKLLHTEDADAVYKATVEERERLREFMSWADQVIDVSDTYRFLRSSERAAFEHTAFAAGIWDGDELAGCIDLHNVDWLNMNANIGYWLRERYTGRGIMTRSVQLLTDYAFDALGLHRIEIRVATANTRSRRIPERLGFTFEGILQHVQRLRGEFLDQALYATVRAD